MIYNEFNEFWDVARKRHVIFFYVGYFSQHIVASISDVIKARLANGGAAGPTRRKIFSSFVEMSQNIMHYSSDSLTPKDQVGSQMRRGSFCIGIDEGSFFLLCANPVATENVEKMRTKLESLHTMTMQEIKDAYKKALREETPRDSQGSGLGFLTLARDASEPLEFEFVQDAEDPNTSIFCIKAII
ncbi:MAG: SiaB family protein kinase [Burkholderiales bacterium]